MGFNFIASNIKFIEFFTTVFTTVFTTAFSIPASNVTVKPGAS
jgi:hypothetical protein